MYVYIRFTSFGTEATYNLVSTNAVSIQLPIRSVVASGRGGTRGACQEGHNDQAQASLTEPTSELDR